MKSVGLGLSSTQFETLANVLDAHGDGRIPYAPVIAYLEGTVIAYLEATTVLIFLFAVGQDGCIPYAPVIAYLEGTPIFNPPSFFRICRSIAAQTVEGP